MRCQGRRTRRGFTLIEFAIVLAVVAVLVGMAAPDLGRTTAQRAIAAQATEFMSAVRFARSEALKRGEAVTLCAADPHAAESQCQSTTVADWRSGWFVFVDRDRRGRRDATDTLLRQQVPLVHTGGVAGTRSAITITAAGFSVDAASHYLFQPPAVGLGQPPAAVLVCVSKQGRPRLAPGSLCD